MIIYCGCPNNTSGAIYQSKKYGNGKRVHNKIVSKQGPPQYRCTCCGKERAYMEPTSK